MAKAKQRENPDVCPVCGKEYESVVGPPNTHIFGDSDEAVEQSVVDGLICVVEVAGKAYVYEHADETELPL